MRALVVTGSEPTRCVLERSLVERGHEVVAVDGPRAAWKVYRAAAFPLVFVDDDLPRSDGPSLCRRLRSGSGADRDVILVLVDPAVPAAAEAALAAGATDCLMKPLDPDMLSVRLPWIERLAVERIERERAEAALSQERGLLRALMDNLPDPIYFKDAASRFTRLNAATAAVLGCDRPDQALGKTDFDFYPEPLARRFAADERRILATGRPLHNQLEPQTRDTPVKRWLLTTKGPVRDPDGQIVGIVGNAKDVTDHERAELALAGQRRVLELLATDATLAEVLDALCRHLEAILDGALCSVLLLDEAGHRLWLGAAPNLPAPVIAAVDGIAIGPAVGSCGTAAYGGQPVIAEDVGSDPRWDAYREPALRHGLRACWSVPIRDAATDRVLGTFAVYCREPRRPSEAELAEVEEACRLAGVAIRSKRAEAALRASEERFRALVQNATDLIAIVEADGSARYQSPSAERLLGYSPEELAGRSSFDFVHPDDLAKAHRFLADVLADPTLQPRLEVRVRHRDGSYRTFEVIATNLLANPAVGGIVANLRDVTDHKAFKQRLWHQAHHDPLTDLPNRALFLDRLADALARAHRRRRRPEAVPVLFLDLDGFKVVNDSLGHDAGDRLLGAVAARLAGRLRARDVLARFGGDEFVVLLGDVDDRDEAARVAERLLTALAEPFAVEGHEVVVSGSVGVVVSSPSLSDPDHLLRAADVALYRAKAVGKGSVAVFDPARDEPALGRLEREIELRRALERGELRVVYQPIVQLATGTIAGVEALVRWAHPDRGCVEPDDFVPLAEETGLIVPLGRWLRAEACRHVSGWQTRHPTDPPLRLSTNLSPREFRQPDLITDLGRTLAESGLRPASLTLEITENAAVADPDAAAATLRELTELDVRLAIDDFGTGYASLSSLRRLPVDELKIDRSFVAGLGRNHEDSAIVRATIGVAKALGLRTTAEGVETAEQATALRELGCDQAQGFYFARALFEGELDGLLRERMVSSADAA